MSYFQVGDIVTRKSYGGDISFKIVDILNRAGTKPVYSLKGMMYRIQADCQEDDLVKQDARVVHMHLRRYIGGIKQRAFRTNLYSGAYFLTRSGTRPGRILHIDADRDFLDMCLKHYREANLIAYGEVAAESMQPQAVRVLLEQRRPDILVVTGHDGIKKDTADLHTLDNYRNSRYFVQSVKEARKYESDPDGLCVFAGACQSYFEAIMGAGANFASSPGRVLINALDPAIVSEKVAITENRFMVTPGEIARITVSGSKGIGGINTRGHMVRE